VSSPLTVDRADSSMREADFHRLFPAFSFEAQACVPCEDVMFLTPEAFAGLESSAMMPLPASDEKKQREMEEAIRAALVDGEPFWSADDNLLVVPLPEEEGNIMAVALLFDCLPDVGEWGRENWLRAGRIIADGLLKVRWWGVDAVTGLPTARALHFEIHALLGLAGLPDVGAPFLLTLHQGACRAMVRPSAVV